MREAIKRIISEVLPPEAVFDVAVSPRPELGHYSTNAAMRMAKEEKSSPMDAATKLAKKIEKTAPKGFFSRVEAAPPGFVNFWISPGALRKEFGAVLKSKNFGVSDVKNKPTVIVEYSQPNIAKKMHVGHLRTTVIGDALANMYDAAGYKVIRWNYYGDWGTQFGKLIAAYKAWGEKTEVQKDPIATLLDLYIRFHDELKFRPELEDLGREEFRKLEAGDDENKKLWKWFRTESLKEFHRTYKMLGVKFDVEIGESFFDKDTAGVVEDLLERGIAEHSGDAVIVPLDKLADKNGKKLPPALVQKSDGASLYHTRDIANIRYRIATYHPAKIIYVVGNEQTLHFEQLFAIAALMDLAPGVELIHVKYGLVLAEEGKKFATREGRVVFLEEVIEKAVRLAYEIVDEKSQNLSAAAKKKVANTVAIGALKYANLKENRHSDIRFDWKKMLDFTGDSAPYLQYTYARMQSIRRKSKIQSSKFKPSDAKYFETENELAIVRKLIEFPDAIRVAAETYATNHLCNYLYELAVAANKFYESTPILIDKDKNRRNARLLLVATVAKILEKGLKLLGIGVLEKI